MKRWIVLALVIIGMSSVLAGCVKTGGSKEQGVTLEEYSAASPLKITFWNFPNLTGDPDYDDQQFNEALIKAFEKKYPYIQVKYLGIDFANGPDEIEAAIAAQTNPDIIYDAPGRGIDWARRGYLAPLDDIVPKEELLDSAVKASSFDGKIYLYPQGVAPFLMGFNRGMLDEMGLLNYLPLDRENRFWSVEEFHTLLQKIKEKRPDIPPIILYAKSQAGDQGTRALIANLYGSWPTDDQVRGYTLNDEPGIKGLEWVNKIYHQGLLGKGFGLDSAAAIEAFGNQQTAGTILYPVNKYKEFTKEEKLDSVLLPYPSASKKPRLEYLVAGPVVFDNGDQDKIEASKLFIDFMINDTQWGTRSLEATGNFSAKVGVDNLYEDKELQFAEKMSAYYGPYYNSMPGFIEMRKLWYLMLQDVLRDKADPKTAMNRFVEGANQLAANK